MTKLAQTTASAILALAKEGLELWKVFLATRQQAYNLKMDRRQERAVQEGEKAIELLSTVFTYVFFNNLLENDRQFQRYKKDYLRIKKRFNKYD